MKPTPFLDIHRRLGGQVVDFAGYAMPVRYKDIGTEHHAVRKKAGLFDLCHMGRVRFKGKDATTLAQRVQTQNVAKQPVGRTRYALLCAPDGGVIDDVLVSREEDGYLFVVNASNRDADLAWFDENKKGLDVAIVDDSERLAMLAVQGPEAVAVLARFGLSGAKDVGYYKFATFPHALGPILVSRTGYTGEDGFELLFDATRSEAAWNALVDAGAPSDLIPCGLGCRDTLRLEAGMPLYGHELDRSINPFEAGLDFGVSLDNPSVALPALSKIKAEGPKRRLVGLSPEGPRIPRQGCDVFFGDERVGVVCSGTLSPTLGKNIATALIRADAATRETFAVDIRGPFYVRPNRS
jgi:aminomethyltransferase